MSIRPEFAARVKQFFDTHGHHYTPVEQAAVEQAQQAPQMMPAQQEQVAPDMTTHAEETPTHHAYYQPRDTGKFAGPPDKKWYDLQGQN
jgi:hypothetical protein